MGLVAITSGQMAYNGYIFNSSWMLSEINYEIETEPVDIPFAPGQFVDPGKPGPKTFMLTGVVGGLGSVKDANGNLITTLDEAQAEVDRIMPLAYQGDQPLQWRSDRYCMAQMSKPKISYMTGNGYRVPMITVQFVANDPRSYAYNANSQNVECAVGGGAVSGNFVTGGSFRAYPTITLTFAATCANPTIKFEPPSGGAYQITLVSNTLGHSGHFQTSDVVEIICDPRNRAMIFNGAKVWAIVSLPILNTTDLPTEPLPFLDGTLEPTDPATTVVTVSADSGRFTATLNWADVWI